MQILASRRTRTTSARVAFGQAGDREAGRFDRVGLLVLALALLLLAAGVAQKAYRLSLPTTGWSATDVIDTGQPVFERNLLDEPSPLRPGDTFVAVDGRSFDELGGGSSFFGARPLEDFRAGERVTFTVLRDGVATQLEVPLYRWNGRGLLQAALAGAQQDYATLLGLLIASFVFWQRPRNRAAQLLFLVYATKLVIDISQLVAPHSVADYLVPLVWWSTLFFSHLSYVLLLAPLVIHLCLSFPEPKPVVARRPWLLWLLYALPWVLALAIPRLSPVEFDATLYGLGGAYPVLGALAFTHTLFTVRDPVRRAQLRWVVLGFAVTSIGGLVYALGALGVLDGSLALGLSTPSELMLTVCLAVALLRYRLFDIDVVINRTLVYGALTVAVVGLYAVIVGGLGVLTGLAAFRAQGSLVVSLVATGLVAVLFGPLRDRLQRVVNRLMYGERDEPYALVARLSRRIEGTLDADQVIPAIVETVAQALKLPYAGVVLYRADGDEVVAEQGVPPAGADAVEFPLTHQGEALGELRLSPRGSGESFSPAELHLLHTVAQQASTAADALRQKADLQRSRERLIAAREEERLRIRRDLHDGLGPTLAGLNLQIGALRGLISSDPAAAEASVDELRGEIRGAISEIRRLVHDLRPPSLDELGLTGALGQVADSLSLAGPGAGTETPRITVDIPPLPPLNAATEVAVYRIVQEALTNAVKHARARSVRVTVRLDGGLTLRICDDGEGLPDRCRAGVGMQSMRERAEGLGGRFDLDSRPGQGTEISVALPLPQG